MSSDYLIISILVVGSDGFGQLTWFCFSWAKSWCLLAVYSSCSRKKERKKERNVCILLKILKITKKNGSIH